MRLFCIAAIGSSLGIIMGLYFSSIASFVLLFFIAIFFIIFIYFLKPILIRKYVRVIVLFLVCFFTFCVYTFSLEQNYQKINQDYDNREIAVQAIVISDKVEKDYKDVYEIQVIGIKLIEEKNENDNGAYAVENYSEKEIIKKKNKVKNQKFKMLLNVKKGKSKKIELKYGDEIKFTANYEAPSTARNEGGFDYSKYLKTKQIVGIISVKASGVNAVGKNKVNIFSKIIHDIKNSIAMKVRNLLPKNTANLCISLILGDKTELSEEIQENFRRSNLSHMLAISGAHVSYILLGITVVIQKCKFNKKWGRIFLIAFLFFFMALVGFTPSVTRACIMAILQLLAGVLFRKSDTYQNLAISSFLILSINPYTLFDIGFQLSFGGTIGIIIFSKRLFQEKTQLQNKDVKDKEDKSNDIANKQTKCTQHKVIKMMIQKMIKSVKEMCIVTLSANLIILPIMMYHFNTVSFTFLISNILASPILGICLTISMIFVVSVLLFYPIAKLVSLFLQPILQLLLYISEISSKLPLSQILVLTPKIWQIIIFYLMLGFIFSTKLKVINQSKINSIIKVSTMTKVKIFQKAILIIFIFIIISPYIIRIFPSNKLTINFIDVGQGDSMLIQTPSKKTILIDGGGSETGSFDIGEKTLLPYLLDRGILQIDYMLFSHFDSDHCKGLFTIMEKLKVKNAIISKQGEMSSNYRQFLSLAKKKKIKIITVQAGDFIQIDKQCSFHILFPEPELISTNVLNNNSIVAKFTYQFEGSQINSFNSKNTDYSKSEKQLKKFTLLLTGDIEEIAEKRIVERYQNTNQLQATILKVAHHRFKNIIYRRISKYSGAENGTYWSGRKKYFWSSKSRNFRQTKCDTVVRYIEQICREK